MSEPSPSERDREPWASRGNSIDEWNPSRTERNLHKIWAERGTWGMNLCLLQFQTFQKCLWMSMPQVPFIPQVPRSTKIKNHHPQSMYLAPYHSNQVTHILQQQNHHCQSLWLLLQVWSLTALLEKKKSERERETLICDF